MPRQWVFATLATRCAGSPVVEGVKQHKHVVCGPLTRSPTRQSGPTTGSADPPQAGALQGVAQVQRGVRRRAGASPITSLRASGAQGIPRLEVVKEHRRACSHPPCAPALSTPR